MPSALAAEPIETANPLCEDLLSRHIEMEAFSHPCKVNPPGGYIGDKENATRASERFYRRLPTLRRVFSDHNEHRPCVVVGLKMFGQIPNRICKLRHNDNVFQSIRM